MKLLRVWLPIAVVTALVIYIAVDGPRLAMHIGYSAAKGRNRAQREQLAAMAGGDSMSPLLAQVAEVVRPAVVEVRVAKKVTVRAPAGTSDFLDRFFGGQGPPPGTRQYVQQGLGSGVVIDANNGYVLTNHHVVAGAEQIEVILPDGRTPSVAWTRSDALSDLAVVKVDTADLIAAPLGDSDAVRVGQVVVAIGAPEALPQTVTAGIISARGRRAEDGQSYQSFLQTDAAINHGNSGGPLVDLRGEVIGINTAIVSESGGNEGIGFAIPSNMARGVMDQLIEKGKVVRGYLGVVIQGATGDLARSFHLPGTRGALVASVAPGGPAERAGLKAGDFIVAIAGSPVRSPNDLRNRVAAIEPGKSVAVEFYRDGRKQSADVTIAAQPANMLAAATTQPGLRGAARFGLRVADPSADLAQQYGYNAEPRGVFIVAVTPMSPAAQAGLQDGMVITQVGGRDVATAAAFAAAVSTEQAAGGVRLRVIDPTGGARYVFLSPRW